MSDVQNPAARIKEVQTELEAKAKVLPDGSPNLLYLEDLLAGLITVFKETTHKEATNQVKAIVQKARQ